MSPGCDNCYAETFDRRVGGNHWGKEVARRGFADKHWQEPLKWNEDAQKAGKRTKVFCASMADVMDDEAPAGARGRLWTLIDSTPYLTWQLLTKRPHRYSRYLPKSFSHNNVWLGVSAENQEFYDVRWPILAEVTAAMRLTSWVSYEPALGRLRLSDSHVLVPDWIICGGESGAGRRPMLGEWAEGLRHECEFTGTAFFMKQMSAQTPKRGAALIPINLMIREFPA